MFFHSQTRDSTSCDGCGGLTCGWGEQFSGMEILIWLSRWTRLRSISTMLGLGIAMAVPGFLSAQTEGSFAAVADSDTAVKINTRELGDEYSGKQRTTTDKIGLDASTDVEIQRRFNDLKREVLEERINLVDWWLTATAIFLTLFAVVVTFLGVVVGIGGYFGFKKFQEEARQNMNLIQEYVERARTQAGEAEKFRAQSEQAATVLNSKLPGENVAAPDSDELGPG